ncbi:MAG TPA: cyclic nucleotide-binding domain-containing protein, partial [Sphingomicrobium sp.]|nr:cyclic nucleotide-binding domain-containing protein [Sphingomicrobium sp.]
MSEESARTLIDSRRDQIFPRLSPADMERLRRFGEPRSFKAGDMLFRAGEAGHGLTLLLSGEVEILQHDETGRRIPIVTHERGSFMGELAQLSGRPALVNGQALTDGEAIEIPPDRLRAVLIAEAELGERIMRALILRRVGLIERGAGPIVVGSEADGDVLRLVNFL